MNSDQQNQNAHNYSQYQHQETFISNPFNINNNQQFVSRIHPAMLHPNFVVQNCYQQPYRNMRQYYTFPNNNYNQNYMNGHMPMISRSPQPIQTLNGPARQNGNQNLSKNTDINKSNSDKTQIVVIDDDDEVLMSTEKIPPQIIKREYQIPQQQMGNIPFKQPPQYQMYPFQQPYYQPTMMFYQPNIPQQPPQAYNYQQMLDISILPPKRFEDTNKQIRQCKNDLKKSQNFDSPSKQSPFSNPNNNPAKFKNSRPKLSVDTLDIDFLEQKKLIYDPETSRKPNTRLQTKEIRSSQKNIISDISGRQNFPYVYEEFNQKKRSSRRKQNIWNQKAPNIKTPMIGVNYQATIPLTYEALTPKFVKKFDHQRVTEEQCKSVKQQKK